MRPHTSFFLLNHGGVTYWYNTKGYAWTKKNRSKDLWWGWLTLITNPLLMAWIKIKIVPRICDEAESASSQIQGWPSRWICDEHWSYPSQKQHLSVIHVIAVNSGSCHCSQQLLMSLQLSWCSTEILGRAKSPCLQHHGKAPQWSRGQCWAKEEAFEGKHQGRRCMSSSVSRYQSHLCREPLAQQGSGTIWCWMEAASGHCGDFGALLPERAGRAELEQVLVWHFPCWSRCGVSVWEWLRRHCLPDLSSTLHAQLEARSGEQRLCHAGVL